jgi:hypothetical protein
MTSEESHQAGRHRAGILLGSVDPKRAVGNIRMPVLSVCLADDRIAPFHNDSFSRVFSLNLVEGANDKPSPRFTDPCEKMRHQLAPASQRNIVKHLYMDKVESARRLAASLDRLWD